MKLSKVTKFLLNTYPLEWKEEWDPCGWSVKFNLSEPIKGIVLAIDLTKEVLDKAVKMDANLILTHHPFKFEETWDIEDIKAPYKRSFLEILKEKRINVLSFHTNYDNDKNGTSHQIAKQLGLSSYEAPYETNYPCILNYETTFNNMVSLIREKLHFNAMRTNIKPTRYSETISKIAILSGSGYIGEINKLALEGFDLIITSDPKWSDWIVYQEINAPVLEIPHLDEQVFVDDMYELLTKNFGQVPIEKVKIIEPYHNI
ncbi:Nif3-like dinuclear metal center hexameric protein [Mycoplasmopsis adleri]|uniref:Nif3-like dinuclear metal center hexameric protein n=1 Tax=Mycoplasmopsis adleri TaxID=51362 RepID=UPI003873177D